jgi:hypothetical protein
VLTADRARGLVALGFGAMLAVAAVLLFTGTGESAKISWHAGGKVPDALPPGATVVDDSIPVAVAPDTTAWTGSELLTFGVRGGRNVGAVYEASSGRWREMSPIPYGTLVRRAQGVWTGRIWVLVGVLCGRDEPDRDGAATRRCDPGTLVSAAYQPDADAWRVVDQEPDPASASFGRGRTSAPLVPIGVLGRDPVFLIDGQYYGLRTDRWDWEWLTPLAATGAPACSTGSVLARYADGRALTLRRGARVWTPSAGSLPPRAVPPLGSVCTRRGLFVYPARVDTPATYDVGAERWNLVPPPTVAVSGVEATAAFTGTSVVWRASPTRVIAFDVKTDTWREAAPGLTVAPDAVTWTGDGYGLYVRGRQLDAYDPGP